MAPIKPSRYLHIESIEAFNVYKVDTGDFY